MTPESSHIVWFNEGGKVNVAQTSDGCLVQHGDSIGAEERSIGAGA